MRQQIKPLRLIFVCFLFALFGTKLRAADADERFVGQWVWKADKESDPDQYVTITHDNGKWTLEGVYKKDDKEIGSYVGQNVHLDGGKLYWDHKFIKKIPSRHMALLC